jgi:hypothetical protein
LRGSSAFESTLPESGELDLRTVPVERLTSGELLVNDLRQKALKLCVTPNPPMKKPVCLDLLDNITARRRLGRHSLEMPRTVLYSLEPVKTLCLLPISDLT